MFNEVFFTEVFVPDDCVVGPVNGGWRLARTTLENERVSMAAGATFGFGIEWLLGSLRGDDGPDLVVLDRLGELLAEAHSVGLLGARSTLRSVSGVEPGPEASVRKLLGAEHEQRLQEFGLMLLGVGGATTEDDAGRWSRGFLSARCLTIAGGTSEVQRNVIGERILGLPRDPEPGA
jgi:alkylation response protein AidB-like acyl-CoA dehydrogenase